MATNVSGECPICKTFGVLHGHHLIPREYGGLKGPVRDICGSCHTGIHTVAESIIAGHEKAGVFTEDTYRRAMPFINMIVLSSDGRYTRKDSPSSIEGMLVLNVPIELRARLHTLKTRLGYTNLEEFIIFLLERIASREQ